MICSSPNWPPFCFLSLHPTCCFLQQVAVNGIGDIVKNQHVHVSCVFHFTFPFPYIAKYVQHLFSQVFLKNTVLSPKLLFFSTKIAVRNHQWPPGGYHSCCTGCNCLSEQQQHCQGGCCFLVHILSFLHNHNNLLPFSHRSFNCTFLLNSLSHKIEKKTCF